MLYYIVMQKTREIAWWDKFGKWTIISEVPKKHWNRYFNCICDCWIVYPVSMSHLIAWESTGCRACWQYKHWMSKTRFYTIWQWLKSRCNNKSNPRYFMYWAVWISYSKERSEFMNFKDDMLESYNKHCEEHWKRETTIDRIDSKKWYCKENCRRATYKVQSRNTKRNIFINWKCINDISLDVWIPSNTIACRLRNWWTKEQAINIPVQSRRWHRKKINYEWGSYTVKELSNKLWISEKSVYRKYY